MEGSGSAGTFTELKVSGAETDVRLEFGKEITVETLPGDERKVAFMDVHDKSGKLQVFAKRDDLGEEEFHLAFRTDDYEGSLRKHTEMGCVAFINEAMGIYFITDPDGYWLEILPVRNGAW